MMPWLLEKKGPMQLGALHHGSPSIFTGCNGNSCRNSAQSAPGKNLIEPFGFRLGLPKSQNEISDPLSKCLNMTLSIKNDMPVIVTSRDLRVYPFTRPDPGTGNKPTGTGIPVFYA
jgi:hypothetical protein